MKCQTGTDPSGLDFTLAGANCKENRGQMSKGNTWWLAKDEQYGVHLLLTTTKKFKCSKLLQNINQKRLHSNLVLIPYAAFKAKTSCKNTETLCAKNNFTKYRK